MIDLTLHQKAIDKLIDIAGELVTLQQEQDNELSEYATALEVMLEQIRRVDERLNTIEALLKPNPIETKAWWRESKTINTRHKH